MWHPADGTKVAANAVAAALRCQGHEMRLYAVSWAPNIHKRVDIALKLSGPPAPIAG